MKIIFLCTRMDKPSTRFRIVQYLPVLNKNGFDAEVKILPKGILNKLKFYNSLSSYDAVILQRKLLNAVDFHLLRKNAGKLIFDFDDAIMFKDSNQHIFHSRRNKVIFERTVRQCDAVIAGNRYLSDMSIIHNPRTSIIPTPVDTGRYTQKNSCAADKDSITIGWIGTASTLIYLKNILPSLTEIHKKFPQVRLKIVADNFFEADGMPVIKKKWDFDEEVSDLHSFDIGVMPLKDDLWARGKCGLKLIQYMSCGIPSICSPVGINSEIIVNGFNGFHAKNHEEWVKRLAALVQNPDLRKSTGSKAAETVRKKYSTDVTSVDLMRILRETANGKK